MKYYKKIKKIEFIGKRKVYDLLNKKNHNFLLSNNLLSHNCDELIREKRMKPSQTGDLAFLEKGQFYVAETGQRVVRKIQVRMPRTMFWKKEYGNFYKNIWERFGGEWKNTSDIKDYVADTCKEQYEMRAEDGEVAMPKNRVSVKELKQEMDKIEGFKKEVNKEVKKEVNKETEEDVPIINGVNETKEYKEEPIKSEIKTPKAKLIRIKNRSVL